MAWISLSRFTPLTTSLSTAFMIPLVKSSTLVGLSTNGIPTKFAAVNASTGGGRVFVLV